eukprot:50693-Eustigmatos_ZCMA.PRE.1
MSAWDLSDPMKQFMMQGCNRPKGNQRRLRTLTWSGTRWRGRALCEGRGDSIISSLGPGYLGAG